MKRFGLLLFSLFFFAPAAQAGNVEWKLDKGHSYIGFSVKHLGITNVRGEFKDFDAVIQADAVSGKVASLEATAKASSIDTGVAARDGHLQGDDFFDAATYPVLTVKSKSIQWNGGKVVAKADLTIRNVTKEVTFTGNLIGTQKVNFGDGDQLRAGYELTATINRKDFGLKFNSIAEGVSVVADEVKITLEIQTSRLLAGQS